MTTTITRAMLTEAAVHSTGLSKPDIAAICDSMFVMMADALMGGHNVKLTAFGSLQVRSRAERVGRNPRTGTEHVISSRQTVVFTPSAQLRQKLADALESPDKMRQSA